MQLEILLSEVQQFLSDQFHIDIDLKNIEENKIEAKYINYSCFYIPVMSLCSFLNRNF